MPEENVTKSLNDLVAEEKAFRITEEDKIKEIPDRLKKKLQEFVEWATIDQAYEILGGQEEHSGIIIAGTDTNPSPHNDIAAMINKETDIVELLVACRVFNQETGEHLDETKIMVLCMPKDKVNEYIAVEESEDIIEDVEEI